MFGRSQRFYDAVYSWKDYRERLGDEVPLHVGDMIGFDLGRTVERFTEAHVVGMFTHERYLDALRRSGLDVDHDEEGLMGRGPYVGRRTG